MFLSLDGTDPIRITVDRFGSGIFRAKYGKREYLNRSTGATRLLQFLKRRYLT